MSLLSSLIADSHGTLVEFSGNGLLVDVSLKAGENNVYFYEFTREIFEKLNPYIYAESDISPQAYIYFVEKPRRQLEQPLQQQKA